MVRLALVPERAAQRKRHQPVDHAVVERGRILVALQRQQALGELGGRPHHLLRRQGPARLGEPGAHHAELSAEVALVLRRGWQRQLDPVHKGTQRRLLLETAERRPGFDQRPAPRRVDQAHRHLEVLVEVTPEEVGHRRETADRLGAAHGPFAGRYVLPRQRGRDPRHLQVADLRPGRRRLLRLEVQRTHHGELHVRLARTQPDLADQDIGQRQRGCALHDQLEGAALGTRRQRHPPGTGRIRLRRHAVFVQGHLHGFPRVGPAPHGDRLAPLQNHVVPKYRRETDRRAAARRKDGPGKQDTGDDSTRCSNHPSLLHGLTDPTGPHDGRPQRAPPAGPRTA